MNTNKQINVMILLVFVSVILTGAWWLIDSERADSAVERQLHHTLRRGAWLYSQNCRVCHGDQGEGGAASNRLRQAPPLNRPDLQGVVDGEVDETARIQVYDFVYYSIDCGRVGRAMPTWGQRHGGTLNDEQLKQLTLLIVEGTEWELAREFAIEGEPEFHRESPDTVDELVLAEAIDAETTTFMVGSLRAADEFFVGDAVSEGLRLQIGDELMLITGAEAEEGAETATVTVERGLGTTSPAAHAEGEEILKPPVPPDPAPVTQPTCGQLLPPEVPDGPPPEPSTELSIVAQGIAWNTDNLIAIAGQPLTLTLDNRDVGTAHNIEFFDSPDSPEGDPIAMTEIENGPVIQTLEFGPLEPGEYFYWCVVHPQMEGVLTAVDVAAEGDGAAP